MKTILIQGAMDSETDQLLLMLQKSSPIITSKHNGYVFYEASLSETKIIVSKTEMGVINACIASMLAINIYKPDIVINQGTAGAHRRDLLVGDIIIGSEAVYINNMRSPVRGLGEGSNALEWLPGKNNSFLLNGDASLAEKAAKIPYCGRVILGRLGTGDIYSREVDRIDLLHNQLGQICEDMESAAVYKVCNSMNIPVIAIRVISNNELTGNSDVSSQFKAAETSLQAFIYKFLLSLITDSEDSQ